MKEFRIEDIPAPGEPLTRRINPENAALLDEEIAERARRVRDKLSRWDSLKLRFWAWLLHKKLNAHKYNQLIKKRWALWQEYQSLRHEIAQHPRRTKIKKRFEQVKKQGRAINRTIAKLTPIFEKYQAAIQRLKSHQAVVNWEREDAENRAAFAREARVWESQMKAVFRQVPRLHHRGEDSRGKPFTDIPRFERILFKEDSVLFFPQVLTQGFIGRLIGRWFNALPYGVEPKHLFDDDTIVTMTAALRRVVSVEDFNGRRAYKISRLDSADGIPNKVLYQRVIEFYPAQDHLKTPWPAGVTKDRVVRWFNFEDSPHVLIAGSTQGGKSNHINQMIASIASMNTLDEVRFCLVDLKGGIEFTHWRGLKHLARPVVKDANQILEALEWLRDVMEKRLSQFESIGAKNLSAFNTRVEKRIPRLIFIIDEMATIIGLGDLTTAIHNHLRVLTSQGRAVGIHVVACTQHSSVDTLPGWIKTNMVLRISAAMPSQQASIVILDTTTAAKLPKIAGRLVFSLGRDEIIAQSPYISDDEIARAVALSQQFPPAEINEFASDSPPAKAPREKFTREKLIELAITEYGGKLTPVKMHNQLTNDVISRRNLQKMIDEIVDSGGGVGGSIWFNGAEYRISKDRKTYTLAQVAQDKDIEDTDNFSAIDVLLEQEVNA